MRLVGDEQIVSRRLTTELSSGGSGRQSLAESTTRRRSCPGHMLRQQPSGSALLIRGDAPPGAVTDLSRARRQVGVTSIAQVTFGARVSRAADATGLNARVLVLAYAGSRRAAVRPA